MRPLSRDGSRRTRSRSARYGGALAVVLALTVAVAGHGTAWADTSGAKSPDKTVTQTESAAGTGTTAEHNDSSAPTAVDAKASDPSSPGAAGAAKESATEKDTAAETLDSASTTATDVEEGSTDLTDGPLLAGEDATSPTEADSASGSSSPEPESLSTETAAPEQPSSLTNPTHPKAAATVETESAPTARVGLSKAPATAPTSEGLKASGLADQTVSARTESGPAAESFGALALASPAALSTAAVETTVVTPSPVSPIAEVIALPGRIVNAVLQLFGITTAAGVGPSPITPAPFADLFFAVFRRLEEAVGLDSPLSGQPVPPSLTYTGPLDLPTPTVAQFLNAATTEYVLGAVPAGMTPFAVDGWPMTSLHQDTGETAKVWVTPQNQIIIAYSGTTGGTNLLFNPLIAISQILTDAQAGFTNTTPKAFEQALDFAKEVQAEAAKQGYAPDSIFVTGHSLGAWEAQYVAQQIGLNGIGFEGPGLPSTVPGNGANALFVNTATYGDLAAHLASDLPGLQPFAPPYVPGGGLKPHYGPIVLLGDPNANTPVINAAGLFGKSIIGSLIAAVDLLGNFFAYHLPGVQAYNLDVDQSPGVVPWLGTPDGPIHTGFGEMTIPEFLMAASDAKILVTP